MELISGGCSPEMKRSHLGYQQVRHAQFRFGSIASYCILASMSALLPTPDVKADIGLRRFGPQTDIEITDRSAYRCFAGVSPDFACVRTCSMNSLTTGLVVRFFNVKAAIGMSGIRKSIGSRRSDQRSELYCMTVRLRMVR